MVQFIITIAATAVLVVLGIVVGKWIYRGSQNDDDEVLKRNTEAQINKRNNYNIKTEDNKHIESDGIKWGDAHW